VPLILDSINNYIRLSRNFGKEPKGIILGHEQYLQLRKEFDAISRPTYFKADPVGKYVMTYAGVPILQDEDKVSITCRMCGKEGIMFEYEGILLCACEEHIDKVKTFYLLGVKK